MVNYRKSIEDATEKLIRGKYKKPTCNLRSGISPDNQVRLLSSRTLAALQKSRKTVSVNTEETLINIDGDGMELLGSYTVKGDFGLLLGNYIGISTKKMSELTGVPLTETEQLLETLRKDGLVESRTF